MINSASNEKIKHIKLLMEKGKVRRREGLFTAEGIRLIKEIPEADIKELYVAESFKEELPFDIKKETVSDELFRKICDTETPQGVLAVVKMREYLLADMTAKKPLILMLEDIQDPGNMGTMFRTAEAAGAAGIILMGECVDVYSPKVVRAAMGALFRLPFIKTVEDVPALLERLKKEDITVYAAAPAVDGIYTDNDYSKASAFLIGNEGNGLKASTIEAVKASGGKAVSIPMAGKTESLNAAVSAAVLMYEAARQRRSVIH